MKFNINKILSEWAYRVDDGQPDVSNPDHIENLREILYHFGLPHKFIVEYVHELTEDSIVKNKKTAPIEGNKIKDERIGKFIILQLRRLIKQKNQEAL